MEKGGLKRDGKGGVLFGGKPFMGFGVNCFNLTSQCIRKEGEKYLFDPDMAIRTLRALKEYDVRVVRFSAGGFYEDGWRLIRDNLDDYLVMLDKVFQEASSLGIGLITSFFWTPQFCDMFDEPMGAATKDPENNGSETLKFMKSYTEAIVKRFSESPAAFMWEYGNEHNLDVDIPWFGFRKLPKNSKRSRRTQWEDMETTENHGKLLTWWCNIVHSADPYARLTGTGDAVPRPCAYHQAFFNQSMQKDSREEHFRVMAVQNPDGVDAMSLHLYSSYGYMKKEYGVDLHGKAGVLGEDVGTYSWDERMALLKECAISLGKTCYVGEFGVGTGEHPYDISEYELQYRAIFESFLKNGIPLALFWNYDYQTEPIPGDLTDHGTGVEYSCNERWEKGRHILGLIREYNRKADEITGNNK